METQDMVKPDFPHPPIPKNLREMLKEYPQHIERLQEALDEYAQKPFLLMPFDGAVWAIEGRLETFVSETRTEVRAAEASGDTNEIEKANQKASLMRRAHFKDRWIDDAALWSYFQANKEVSE
jgi:hypothetical protein